MDLDILTEDSRWEALDLPELTLAALDATFAHLGVDAGAVEMSVLACNDARIATLNTDFRGKPVPTNVLSWPAAELGPDTPGANPSAPPPGPDGSIALGDIALAYETCAREAADLDKPLAAHATHLIVHGTLHLLGYDHIRDPDATLMESLESEILGKLGYDDPYNA